MNLYEHTIIARQDTTPTQLKQLQDKYSKIIEKNEGDLVISTSDTNAKNINFMAKYGRGLICLALDSLQAKRLNLSLMSPVNQSRNKTAFTVSIEAKKGITTGISAIHPGFT